MANVINSLNFDNTQYVFTLPYGECSTAAATAAKVVNNVDNFHLETGARIAVKFTVANSATGVTLNVNSSGAKSVLWHGADAVALRKDEIYELVYTGSSWEVIGQADTNTTYSAATTASAGLMSAADKVKLNGIEAGANKFTYTHPTYTARTGVPTANATLTHGGTFAVSQPVSDATGHITAVNTRVYTLPSDNNTDTKNTTGATASTAKLFLVGATTQTANPVTYSSSAVYMTNGTLNASTFAGYLNGTAAKASSATKATTATNAGTATYATSAGSAGSANTAGTATYATSAGTASKATTCTNAGTATYATSAGSASKATTCTNAGTANYAKNAGTANYAKAVASHDHSYLPLAGGTLTGNVVFNKGATSQSGEPNLTWKTVGENTPYIGFAQDQTDGTFILGSLKGTNYQAGLAIGGGSGNLLWKGAKVATVSDTVANATNASTSSYATKAGTATYATSAGSASKATTCTNAGTATYASSAGKATTCTNAGTATYATSAGSASKATTCTNAGTATYASSAAKATTCTNAGTANYAKNVASHNHSASNITSGTLPLTRGGTGSTTAAGALANLGGVAISSIVDNLTSTSTTAPLSANQGNVLREKFSARDIDTSDIFESKQSYFSFSAKRFGGLVVARCTIAGSKLTANTTTTIAKLKVFKPFLQTYVPLCHDGGASSIGNMVINTDGTITAIVNSGSAYFAATVLYLADVPLEYQ